MGNRIIKFRAWDKEHNQFFEPTYEAYKGNLEDLMIGLSGHLFLRTTEGVSHQSLFPDRFMLQQFTGKKDSDGKDIYEGDILEDIFEGRKDRFVVKWYDYSFGVFDAVLNRYAGSPDYMQDCLKVIGNIYENPDLLK